MASSKKMYPRRVFAILCVPVLVFLAQPSLAFFIPGVIITILGEGLRLWAAGHLRKNKDVITSGPYAHVRNPLYVGTFLVIFGFCVAASSLKIPGIFFLLFVLPGFCLGYFYYYLPYKCRIETDRLERRFHEDAKQYNETVPAFIPRLSPYPGEKQKWQFHLIFENSEFGTFSTVMICLAILTLKFFVRFPPLQ